MLDKNDLQKLSNIDIKDINKDSLKELTEFYINHDVPIEERIERFLEYIENPYCFLIDGTPVQISYNNHNTKTLDNCIYNYLENKKNIDN